MSLTIDETCNDLINQIKKSGNAFVESLRTTKLEPLKFENLILCGMGGSGISANYVAKLAEYSSPKRVVIIKDYTIPDYVDASWGSVVISYSGNTEETLHCFNALIEKGLKPVCITSNGKLKVLAEEHQLQFIQIPQGIAPRAAFPYLFGSLYGLVAESLDLDLPSPEMENLFIATSDLEDTTVLDAVSQKLRSSFPLILTGNTMSNVGLRFRCQLNENSKKSAANFELPEFSHNGIVGFDGHSAGGQAIIVLRSDFDYKRANIHLDFYRDNITVVDFVHEFKGTGSSLLEQMLTLTWRLDYISVKLAQLENVDPLGVPSINKLKGILRSIE